MKNSNKMYLVTKVGSSNEQDIKVGIAHNIDSVVSYAKKQRAKEGKCCDTSSICSVNSTVQVGGDLFIAKELPVISQCKESIADAYDRLRGILTKFEGSTENPELAFECIALLNKLDTVTDDISAIKELIDSEV